MEVGWRVLTLASLAWSWGSVAAHAAPRGGWPPAAEPAIRDGAVFDYIVVGAGAAGAAVAARLALARRRVLLVEAGGEPGLATRIPKAAMAWIGTAIDWNYDTISNNKSCLASRGRRCRFSRGRCLGGSTSINYMLYTRGNPTDYDLDVPGWSWREFRPYFLRYEGLQSHLPSSSRPYHNTSGLVEINFFSESKNPWRRRITESLIGLGFPFNVDVNAESQIGVTQSLGYVSIGERVSSATAYLSREDVKKRLEIAKHTVCTGIIIDENNVARGVMVVQGISGKNIKFYARREVILSAGTIGSAQLLMLSGIGPAPHLTKLGIPVRVELPVGENMSDHVMPFMLVKVDRVSGSNPNLSLLGDTVADAVQWLATRTGPLASLGVTDITAFANTRCYNFQTHKLDNIGPECDIPNLQIIFAYLDRSLTQIAPYIFKQIFGQEVFDQIHAANVNSAFLVVAPVLLRPRSRGWIRLASADPIAPPAISPNYLDDEEDVHEIVKSVAIVEQMVLSRPFRQHNASLLKLKLRECPDVDEVGYWGCYVRHMTSSVHHAVGTAALGQVVDARLRVRGVGGLRVGDASVLPVLPRGNTAAAAIAVGERLADFVLDDHNTPS